MISGCPNSFNTESWSHTSMLISLLMRGFATSAMLSIEHNIYLFIVLLKNNEKREKQMGIDLHPDSITGP